MDQVFQAMDLPAAAKENEIKNSIEKNKSEIQGAQRAYILEQMAVPMKEKVQEELNQTYELEIVDLQVHTNSGTESLKPEDITGVKVVLANHHESAGISEVSEVEVSISEKKHQAEKDGVPEEIVEFLASQWQLDEQQLEVEMEGGEESSQ